MFINSNIDLREEVPNVASTTAGVESISLHTNSTKDAALAKRENNSNILPAAVFISLPYKLITCGQRRLSSMFASNALGMEVAGTSSKSKVMQDWDTLIEQFSDFILSSIPSVVLSMDEITFKQHKFLHALVSLAADLNPDSANNASDHTLLSELHERNKMALNQKKQVEETEGEEEISQIKSLRIHLILLAKDILVLFPSAIPEYISSLLDLILPVKIRSSFNEDAHAFLFAPKSYPNANECLFVLVLTQIAASQVTLIRNRRSGTKSSGSMSSADTLAADNFFLSLLTESLTFLSSVLNRMIKYGGNGDKSEVQSYICDLCDVCLSIDVPTKLGSAGLIGRDRRRAQLLDTWTKSNTFQMLLDEAICILFPTGDSSSDTTFLSSSDISVDTRLSPVEVRVLHALSSAMLQSSQVADMTFKILKTKIKTLSKISTLYSGNGVRLNYMCGFGLSFMLGLNNALAIQHSSDQEEKVIAETAALECCRYIVQSFSDKRSEGDFAWKLNFVATGLQSSLELILNEFQGLGTFQAMISKYQKVDRIRWSEWKKLNIDLFELLNSGAKSTDSASSASTISASASSNCDDDENISGKKSTTSTASVSASGLTMIVEDEVNEKGKVYHKSAQVAKSVLSNSQIDMLRVQLKKLRSVLNDEPLGSDKVD